MFKKIIGSLRPTPEFPELAPDTPFSAIGDIHGRADLLERALARDGQIICVGDYIDRGEESAEVLRMLSAQPDIICLSGNHEEMMLNFLAHPVESGGQWLRYGGLQTLASFGVAGASESIGKDALVELRDQLQNAMGAEIIAWLNGLPRSWQSGNVAVVHAGADPAVAINTQLPKTLHWGHPEFEERTRKDGVWVVHGHTIVDTPTQKAGRIAIDTGAYATGKLTVVHVRDGKAEFDVITR